MKTTQELRQDAIEAAVAYNQAPCAKNMTAYAVAYDFWYNAMVKDFEASVLALIELHKWN